MNKSILLALALSLSGSALASDITDLADALKGSSNWVENNNSELCKSFKRIYPASSTEFKCFTMATPLYITTSAFTIIPLIYKNSTSKDKESMIQHKYSYGTDKEFTQEYGNFFTYTLSTDLSQREFEQIQVVLDPTSRYSTDILMTQRHF